MTTKYIIDDDFSIENILDNEELRIYPSLCFALGRKIFISGSMPTNLDLSYIFLKLAELGYKNELDMNHTMYKTSYENVKEYLKKDCYNEPKKKLIGFFDED